MATKPTDPTFRSYSTAQAKSYAAHRSSYDPALYQTVFDFHNGEFGLLLDCGCGPGNATRDLALHFERAVGTDAGAAMIEAARGMGGKTKGGRDIRYEVAAGEEISGIEGLEGVVDVLTVAMAVHWFDMNTFYAEAAKVLKPGGTLALWTYGNVVASGFPHPDEPNAEKVKEIMLHFEHEVIGQYELPGNRLSRDMYDKLPLPWQVSPPVPAFFEADYVKHDYDRDGILTNGKTFFSGGRVIKLSDMEDGLATASMVTRWREAHPDLVGTDEDCVKVFVQKLREALGGKEELLSGGSTTVMLFRKSA